MTIQEVLEKPCKSSVIVISEVLTMVTSIFTRYKHNSTLSDGLREQERTWQIFNAHPMVVRRSLQPVTYVWVLLGVVDTKFSSSLSKLDLEPWTFDPLVSTAPSRTACCLILLGRVRILFVYRNTGNLMDIICERPGTYCSLQWLGASAGN